MKARRFLSLLLAALAVVAAACTSGGGVGESGQAIKAATFYNVNRWNGADRWTPKKFAGPALTAEDRITTGFLAGKVSVINFWASWCGPCRTEQPELEAAWKAYETKGVQFLGVNIRDNKANAIAHLQEYGVTYPSVFNPDSTIAFAYRVLYAPTTYVLDSRGRVAARITGATTDALQLDRIIDEVLAS